MRLSIEGFETQILIERGIISELSVCNKALYARLAQSLLNEGGERAVQPYRLYSEEGVVLNPRGALLFVETPFCLPWNHKLLSGALYRVFEERLFEEDATRRRIEEAASSMNRALFEFGLSFQSDLAFSAEWDVKKYLKAFGYNVDLFEGSSLLDSLIQFFALSSDVGLRQPVVFVGLESFFTEEDLVLLFEQAIFFGMSLLLLESQPSTVKWQGLRKYTFDQHFLEY